MTRSCTSSEFFLRCQVKKSLKEYVEHGFLSKIRNAMLLHVCTSCFVSSKIVSTAVAMYAFGSTSEPVVQCIFTARMCTAVHSIILPVHPCILPSRSSHNCGPICAVTSFIPLCPHMPAAGGRHARSRSRPVAVAGADIRSALARGATARPSTTTLSPSQQAALFELPLSSLEAIQGAWEEVSPASSSLLLLANLRLLPDAVRLAFGLPSPEQSEFEVDALTSRVKEVLRLAVQFRQEQLNAWRALTHTCDS